MIKSSGAAIRAPRILAPLLEREHTMSDDPQGTQTWIDRIATLFDRAWQAGEHPRIEDYLEGVAAPRRSQLLEELLRVELDNRRAAGETPSPEDYVIRFPESKATIRAIVTGGAIRKVYPSSADAATTPQPPRDGCGRSDGDGLPSIVGRVDAKGPYHPRAVKADADATLSYCVARDGGKVEPLLCAQDIEQLARIFTPGMVLQGRYLLERELGRGAMGIVFLGRDNRLDRPVAIKAVLPGESGWRARGPATEKQLQDRFLQEAKIGANLTHPAIATVHDFGYHGDAPFTVFEYVRGPTLHEVLKHRSRIPLEEVQLIIGSLAQALDFPHSRFVVHRDLKPANIKMTEQDHFKILDLGLATEFRHQSNWAFCGTPAYASPEQASGLPVDGRADQYALALITFEMLTSRRVFESTSIPELLEMHRAQEPLSARLLIPALNESTDAAITRALSKDPEKRYPCCVEFAVAIGCQLLTEKGQLPVILLEAEIEPPVRSIPKSLTPSWIEPLLPSPLSLMYWWIRLLRLWGGQGIHLILTPDNLWGLHGFEAFRIPLEDLDASTWFLSKDSTLRVVTKHVNDLRWRSFEFPTYHACQAWRDTLEWACKSLSPSRKPQAGSVTVEQIVRVKRLPTGRYLLLGHVEAQGLRRKPVRSGMLLRARMAGADAVVDHQEERVFGPNRHTWRSTASAIRAVDSQGRWQLKSRWFSGEIRRRAVICLVTIVSLFLLSILWFQFGLGVAVLLPFLLCLALHQIQWAQLIRPTALAILFLSSGEAAVLVARLVKAFISVISLYAHLSIINSVWILSVNSMVLFTQCTIHLFAGRYLWDLRAAYRALLLDTDSPPPRVRTAVGLIAYALVAVYLLLLVAIVVREFGRF
jgi:serine/threonine protein kinase